MIQETMTTSTPSGMPQKSKKASDERTSLGGNPDQASGKDTRERHSCQFSVGLVLNLFS